MIGLENQFLVFFLSGRLRQVLLYLPQNKSYMPSMFHQVGEAVYLCTGQLYIVGAHLLDETRLIIYCHHSWNMAIYI